MGREFTIYPLSATGVEPLNAKRSIALIRA